MSKEIKKGHVITFKLETQEEVDLYTRGYKITKEKNGVGRMFFNKKLWLGSLKNYVDDNKKKRSQKIDKLFDEFTTGVLSPTITKPEAATLALLGLEMSEMEEKPAQYDKCMECLSEVLGFVITKEKVLYFIQTVIDKG